MSVSKLAYRYAKSLLDLAIEGNVLETVTKDVQAVKDATTNRDFYLLLKSPIVNVGKKRQIFQSLFEGRLDKLTLSFLYIILTKGREPELPQIMDEFIAQYKTLNEITDVKITSAEPLDNNVIDEITSKLTKSGAVKKVNVKVKIDPSLIGGFILEFDDKLIDTSVAHQLKEMKKGIMDKETLKQN